MAEIDRKWEGMEEFNKPMLMMAVLHLRGDLLTLGRLTKYKVPPRRPVRSQRHAMAYLMGDAGRLGFGSVLWDKG